MATLIPGYPLRWSLEHTSVSVKLLRLLLLLIFWSVTWTLEEHIVSGTSYLLARIQKIDGGLFPGVSAAPIAGKTETMKNKIVEAKELQ